MTKCGEVISDALPLPHCQVFQSYCSFDFIVARRDAAIARGFFNNCELKGFHFSRLKNKGLNH